MTESPTPLTIAAIDVGSTAIRMEISEIFADGSFRNVENLSRGVSLGKDTFTSGSLSEDTMQEACQVLSDFARVMKLYGVAKYRAVATSAVREAGNTDTFLDRVFMRSGIDVEVIDGSEENRLMYLAIFEAVRDLIDLKTQNTLIIEIGGGSTDISFLQGGKPLQSGTFALGALRMRQALIGVKGELKHRTKILDRQIKNAIDTIGDTIPFDQAQEVIFLGSDVRFAARQLSNTFTPGAQAAAPTGDSWILDKKEFIKFCNEVAKHDVDELVRKYSLSYAQAETVVPALIAYRNMIERTKLDRVHVMTASIRAGLLLDMSRREFSKEIETFDDQILASARALAKKYHSAENHIEQVRQLSLSLFDQLQADHGLERRERLLLEIAALLHDVGSYISQRSHHKHTQYIIAASEIFGLSSSDMNLISNIARYHRKSPPTRAHINYTALDRESRMIVSKLAAILRIADALDQDYSRKVKNIKVVKEDDPDRYTFEVEADGDMTMERLSLEAKSNLFKEIYGKQVSLRQVNPEV